VLAGAVIHELLRGSLAPLLPGLGRRLGAGLLVAGLLAAAATAWWCDQRPGAQRVQPFLGFALLWFALGTTCVDPAWLRLGRLAPLPQVLAQLPALIAPEIVALGESSPLVYGTLALAAGALLLVAPGMRAILLVRQAALANSTSATSTGELGELGSERGAARPWRPSLPLETDEDWIRATLHEGYGNVRGGWLGAVAGYALVWSAILVGMMLVTALLEVRGTAEVARCLHATLAGGPDGMPAFAPVALCVWAAMFCLAHPIALHGAGPYPLARGRRATVTWRACARTTLGLTVGPALVLMAASELALRISGQPAGAASGPPHFLLALLAAACCAPLAQAVRLRWFDEREPQKGLPSSLVGLYGALVAVPSIALALLWQAGVDDAPLAVLGSALGTITGFQLGWRGWLERHYAAHDLPA
jgi:hypothetical protein